MLDTVVPQPEPVDGRLVYKFEGLELPVEVENWCKLQRRMGKGVFAARDLRRDKKMVEVRVMGVRGLRECGKVLRELRILKTLGRHENIQCLKGLVVSRGGCSVTAVVTFFDADLSCIMKNQLTETHQKYLIYQILRGVKYAHSAGIHHSALDPSCVRVNSRCTVGLSHFRNEHIKREPGVSCYWYVSPECCLGATSSPEDDLWAIGCLFGFILSRKPLFPGCNPKDQLSRVYSSISSLPSRLPSTSPAAVGFLQYLLAFTPATRPKAAESLCHPYLSELHSPGDEPRCPRQWVELPPTPPEQVHEQLQQLA